jgi:hypothetical protein
MFNDAHLPDTDAWGAMTRDLRQSKESRNALSKENSYVPAINPSATRCELIPFLSQATQAAIGRDGIRERRVRPACFLSRIALRCHVTVLLIKQ